MDGRIFHIQEKLSRDLRESWTVERMAVEVKTSVSHFQKLFRDNLGITPHQYLNDLRLEKAYELLSEPDCFLRIKEIRILVGITTASTFTREFKTKFGKTPIEFRKHCWRNHQVAMRLG
jgi:AraC-like DNA-binding protein